MTFNELVDEALNSGADIQGNSSLGFFMFPNEKYNRTMCYNLIERLDDFSKKEGKILNLKIKEVKNEHKWKEGLQMKQITIYEEI